MIARVEPLVTTRALRGPFDYRLPERLSPVGVGSLLLVPFGPQRLLGVVVDLAERSELPPERLAEPVAALEAGVPPDLVRLAQWLAREYVSTPARALELVLPPGVRRGGREARARERRLAARTPAGAAALADSARLGARQRSVLEALASGERDTRELRASTVTLRRLAERGLIEVRAEEVARRPRLTPVGAPAAPVTLSESQAAAVAAVKRALDGLDAERELLLHGVTASGKTEVYLAAAAAALERGRGVIVLVPEIALTPQTVARFSSRFGDVVALLHSRLSEGERRDEWMRLRRGEARIAVGPRSAVFAPVEGLGLVVVDEEHDASYKQEKDPRYDARAVAMHRARQAGAVLLAGTATPRPESWLGLHRLELPQRVDGRPLPAVEVLDMRGAPGRAGPLHPQARMELAATAQAGGKAIVLLNRRGWAPHLACRDCGRVWQCPNCDVSLVIHSDSSALRCHHCGHGEALPEACSECRSVTLSRHGTGTERLERIVAELVAPAPTFRLDADSATGPAAHAEILHRFERADAGVLLGTQMVAKGHDFPAVTLALVLDADATLRFPDFRAEERTFALIAQLAGRSGRGSGGGKVLVQTLAPAADAIRLAAGHDSAGFVAAELERRRALGYPPFCELVRIELAAADEEALAGGADALARRLSETVSPPWELLGPAPRFRLRGRHRRQIIVRAPAGERRPLVAAVRTAIEAPGRRELRGLSLAVDVDPQ